ncbi:MAG TPA: zf-HC2 domain-containing protein, partial [Egibacteraceae bacterium]|nr:zf-HC2 domain-containing protein [Egibacteraceae bacterium]
MRDACAATEHLHSAWVDGELRTIERARVAAHLQRCARCRAAVHQLRVTQAMLRSLPARRMPSPVPAPPADAMGRPARTRRVLARSAAGIGAGLVMLMAA